MALRMSAAHAGAVMHVPELGVPGAGPLWAFGGGDDAFDGAEQAAVEDWQGRRWME